MIKTNSITYGGWQNCRQISNGKVEVIATTKVGPRIIHFGFRGGENQFYLNPDEAGLTGGNEWHLYGGHRLWIAPEDSKRTFYPDNHPVEVEIVPNGLRLTAEKETTSGFQKSIQIELDTSTSHIHLIHTLFNCSQSVQSASAWALSVMRPGGVAILPHSPRSTWPEGLTARNNLSLWAYTRMADPRWTWGDKYILLRQTNGDPQKIGMFNTEDWAAYLRDGQLFIKFFQSEEACQYPDRNSNLETWTNQKCLELETLGPIQKVAPGEIITLIEDWYLYSDIPAVQDDAGVEKDVLPIIKKCREHLLSLQRPHSPG